MVKHMRIDNRLIHGQVTTTWVGQINADLIMVVNDKVSKDPIQTVMLPMAARGVKTLVLSIEDAIKFIQENEKTKIMIVAKFGTDALALMEAGIRPVEVNMGNQAPLPGTKYEMVTKSIAVTKEDASVYRKIAELNGGSLTTQMMPSNPKQDFVKLMDAKGL
ncbi:PTS sugar transporter subunit IIB [Gottschalkiaceae bacterium SANA]|nr:PTS sugar transporter subunit IIB [Gottschalkiaceae bacterium SANA]